MRLFHALTLGLAAADEAARLRSPAEGAAGPLPPAPSLRGAAAGERALKAPAGEGPVAERDAGGAFALSGAPAIKCFGYPVGSTYDPDPPKPPGSGGGPFQSEVNAAACEEGADEDQFGGYDCTHPDNAGSKCNVWCREDDGTDVGPWRTLRVEKAKVPDDFVQESCDPRVCEDPKQFCSGSWPGESNCDSDNPLKITDSCDGKKTDSVSWTFSAGAEVKISAKIPLCVKGETAVSFTGSRTGTTTEEITFTCNPAMLIPGCEKCSSTGGGCTYSCRVVEIEKVMNADVKLRVKTYFGANLLDEHVCDDPVGNLQVVTTEWDQPNGCISIDDTTQKCEKKEKSGDCGGQDDPHLWTWKGTMYDYHGQCDLIFTTCPGFDGGKGLDVHLRTEFVEPRKWSTISAIAVRIGDDVLEVQNSGEHYLNGEPGANLTGAGLAGHAISHGTRETVQTCRHVGMGNTAHRCEKWLSADGAPASDACRETCGSCGADGPACGDDPGWRRQALEVPKVYTIELGGQLSIEIGRGARNTGRGDVGFKIQGVHNHRQSGGRSLADCEGLSSTWDHPEGDGFLVGRDGAAYGKGQAALFGPEWQVDLSRGDPMIFAEDVGQQLPQNKCVESPFQADHRHLERLAAEGGGAAARRAERACRDAGGGDDREACLFDVLVTGDPAYADAYDGEL